MKDRFDLEVEIMDIYTLRKPLEVLARRVLDGDIDNEEVSNIIIGIASMLDLYSESLYDTMCQAFRLDKYRSEIPNEAHCAD